MVTSEDQPTIVVVGRHPWHAAAAEVAVGGHLTNLWLGPGQPTAMPAGKLPGISPNPSQARGRRRFVAAAPPSLPFSLPFLRGRDAILSDHSGKGISGLFDRHRGARVYAGFDPTASSLHVGHMITLNLLRLFARHGVEPVVVVGGATALLGDPSGRGGVARPVYGLDEIAENARLISEWLREKTGFEVVNNATWHDETRAMDFFRSVGNRFFVGEMIAKRCASDRLEGLRFTEFAYPLFQAADFEALYRRYNVRMQIGGGDQWGNIAAGLHYTRGAVCDDDIHGLTHGLLLASNGQKISKTLNNAVMLRGEAPIAMHRWAMRQSDDQVGYLLKALTATDPDHIAQILADHAQAPERSRAQRALANDLTAFVHGVRLAAIADRVYAWMTSRRPSIVVEPPRPEDLIAAFSPSLVLNLPPRLANQGLANLLARIPPKLLSLSRRELPDAVKKATGWSINNHAVQEADLSAPLPQTWLFRGDSAHIGTQDIAVIQRGASSFLLALRSSDASPRFERHGG